VVGQIAGKEMAALVCETCAELGQERLMREKVLPLLPPSEDGREHRLIRPGPAGHA
jgi:hypothetical protein